MRPPDRKTYIDDAMRDYAKFNTDETVTQARLSISRLYVLSVLSVAL